jgi:flagella basal body P-ring formation protein FlgA
MSMALLALASAVPGEAVVDRRASIELHGPTIRIGDVIREMHGSAAAIEIARLPAGRSSITLSRGAVAALIRRAVPALALGDPGPSSFTFRRLLPPSTPAACFVARQAVAAGEVVRAERAGSDRCAAAAAPTRYNAATGAIVATSPLAAGDVIGRALPKAAPDITRGDALTLVSRSGPVTVERPVAALQPARRGGRVFVRTTDGQVFAMRVAEDKP